MSHNNARGQLLSLGAGGDISGVATSLSVIGIQNNKISSNAPNNGDVLSWDSANSNWVGESFSPAVFYSSSGITTKTSTIVSSDRTVISTDEFILNSNTSTINVYLPATAVVGRILSIQRLNGYINVVPYSGTKINNSSSTFSGISVCYIVCFDGTNWTGLRAII